MIFHSRSYAAPHGHVGSGVVAIVTRTGRCEVDITAMLRMLGRENVIEHCNLVEVAVGSVGICSVEKFGELQHIVGVARLGAVDVVHVVDAGFLGGEVFASAVSAEGK